MSAETSIISFSFHQSFALFHIVCLESHDAAYWTLQC